ncbi:MAG: hypothetical protein EPN25_08370 [Nitrospirae bacterium]|nr:MAG: hypothetical protein EPN25_08370 [Nitrospirota bacterium]
MLLPLLFACGSTSPEHPVDCRIDDGPCSKVLGDQKLQVVLDIGPKPVRTMKRLSFRIALQDSASAAANSDVKANTDATTDVFVDLSMPGMTMAENRVSLRRDAAGLYTGEGVIVRCTSGKKVWKAEVSVRRPGRSADDVLTTPFFFRVTQ